MPDSVVAPGLARSNGDEDRGLSVEWRPGTIRKPFCAKRYDNVFQRFRFPAGDIFVREFAEDFSTSFNVVHIGTT